MRVITVVNWLVTGGIEVMMLRYLPLLKARGITLEVCCLGGERDLDGAFRDQGCVIHRIGKHVSPYRTAEKIRRLVHETGARLVHSMMGYTSGGLALGARTAGVPCIVSFHSAAPTALYNWRNRPVLRQVRGAWLGWHRRLMERNATIFVGHSLANLDAYHRDWTAEPKRYRLLYNGVSSPGELWPKERARQELGLPGHVPIIMHVGSFRPEKNHEGLLRIFREVLKSRPQCVMVLVGDGPLRGSIQELSRELGIAPNVRFAGLQSDVWRFLAAADVFLFTSELEGLGNALIESQFARVPVVASDIPAHRESVAPCYGRFLFPLHDHAQAARLVIEHLEMPADEKGRLLDEAAAFVRGQFSIETMADRLAALYEEVAEAAEAAGQNAEAAGGACA